MHYPSSEIELLYQQALIYDQHGDAYNTIKLFKKIIKLAPEWPIPYAKLGHIYKYRKDWKAALHYNKKAVALDPSNRTCWWDKGIAATALKKPRVAKRVWAKFGYKNEYLSHNPLLSLRLTYEKRFEILWANAISPALAVLSSIPHPDADRRFKDIVLRDGQASGYTVSGNKRYEVFEELGIFKRSLYKTFSVTVFDCDEMDLAVLEQLCKEAGIGFENWSNATKVFTNVKPKEYYGPNILPSPKGPKYLMALAAVHEKDVLQVLESWTVISLAHYTDLIQHHS